MSHFTVLVIGDDYEGQLEPYDENIEAEPVRVDYSFEEIEQAKAYHRETLAGYETWVAEGKPEADALGDNQRYWKYRTYQGVETGQVPKAGATDKQILKWYHDRTIYEETDADGEVVYYWYDKYNHESKWDWYQVGGRWAGYFKLKDGVLPTQSIDFSWGWEEEDKQKKINGNFCDRARKGDVDFDGMRQEAAEEAGKIWDEYQEVVTGTPPLIPWKTYRDKYPDNVQQARNEYHEQERMLKIRDNKEFKFSWDPEQYEVPRSNYIIDAENSRIPTYAFVKDGEWVGKGEMGWFGMSSNEEDQASWNEQFNKLLNDLPDDTWLTLVDCHI